MDDAARGALARLDGAALARAEGELARAWGALARGEVAGLRERAKAIEARASRAQDAGEVIEAASLAAAAALEEDDVAGALAIARRASRMSRTEALPEAEHLANLVLARIRRHTGRPHLATRIVAALARVCPPAWQGALAVELELSGASDVAARARARAEPGPALAIAEALAAIVAAAGRGDRGELDRAAARAREAARSFAPAAAEIERALRAIDPREGAGAGALGEFLAGRSDAMPGSLAGLASIPRRGEPHALVRVIAAPGAAPPRRVLAIGSALADAREIGREAGAKQQRRETALAILLLAGPAGLAKEDLFRAIWGFAFVPHLHQGVLDVLLHRVRAAVGDAGTLAREGGRIALALRAAIAVADPRAEHPLDDRVLALVSAHGGAARAREIAERLDVPLRTAQAALARLVEEGDCLREGEGQNVVYRVEDTTFREPTAY